MTRKAPAPKNVLRAVQAESQAITMRRKMDSVCLGPKVRVSGLHVRRQAGLVQITIEADNGDFMVEMGRVHAARIGAQLVTKGLLDE